MVVFCASIAMAIMGGLIMSIYKAQGTYIFWLVFAMVQARKFQVDVSPRVQGNNIICELRSKLKVQSPPGVQIAYIKSAFVFLPAN